MPRYAGVPNTTEHQWKTIARTLCRLTLWIMDGLQTSALSLISSIHGRERRAQRAIAKCDLQAAIKHGSKEVQINQRPGRHCGQVRYKYTFADVVYITDSTSRLEITSWAEPIPLDAVGISPRAVSQHKAAKARIEQDPPLITSHSVLVVDQSGSMRKSDVEAHRSRSDAVFYQLASTFLARKLLDAGSGATPFDVVTLIEMRDTAELVFLREPMSWVLHNMLVERAQLRSSHSHGNYLPSLAMAFTAFQEMAHADMALFLLFLSDGRPSDGWSSDGVRIHSNEATHSQIITQIRKHARGLGDHGIRLNFGMAGIGSDVADFAVMKEMAMTLQSCGAQGSFHYASLSSENLSDAFSTMSSSLAMSRTLLTQARSSRSRTERKSELTAFEGHLERPDASCGWLAESRMHRVELVWSQEANTFVWEPVPFQNEHAVGVCRKVQPFGRGAERLVYQFREVDSNGLPLGVPLVAKDSRFVEDSRSSNVTKLESLQLHSRVTTNASADDPYFPQCILFENTFWS